MGKRSSFKRNPRDFYPTPERALAPLLSHLSAGTAFVEPCAGDGHLIGHLSAAGHPCVWAGDIEPGAPGIETFDAIGIFSDMTPHCRGADAIITNPPWARDALHRMIHQFRQILPTWLLLDADWAHTVQAAPFLPYCHKIVAVGRVKWIEGSKHTGKDNCCWHLFGDAPGPTEFVGRVA